MRPWHFRREYLTPLLLGLVLPVSGCALKASSEPSTPALIPRTEEAAPYFVVDGKPFCFAGTNNYYLMYQSEAAVLNVLETAAEMNLSVLRTWGFLDRGSLDESIRSIREPGHKNGIYFQYWDTEKAEPAYNDGPTGLEKLDFVLHHARRLNIKLLITLTNSWRDFGGMDQYLVWYGLDKHHEFYTDERVKQAYRAWVSHLLNRTNSIDGVPYKDDPGIFAWELANEPRTTINEDFDSRDGWDPTTIVEWAQEMASYIKSIDSNHMVAVGDEGFFNRNGSHWTSQAEGGVDHEALTALADIDFGTFHLYPDHWGTKTRWGIDWIESHIEVARRLGKPTLLEEYGIQASRKRELEGPITQGAERREIAFADYNNAVMNRGGAGALFWMLSGIESGQELYPDYDHFTVYRGDRSFDQIKEFATKFGSESQACVMAKHADHGPPSPFVAARSAPAPLTKTAQVSPPGLPLPANLILENAR